MTITIVYHADSFVGRHKTPLSPCYREANQWHHSMVLRTIELKFSVCLDFQLLGLQGSIEIYE